MFQGVILIFPALVRANDPASVIESRGFLERLPLKAVVAEDDKRHIFLIDNLEQLPRTFVKLFFILIMRPGFAIRGEEALHHYRVDCQEYGTGNWKADQDRLVAGNVPAGFNEAETGEKFNVAIDEAVTQGWVVPVRTCARKAGMAAEREVIVRTLDDELGGVECIVEAGVVNVEVGADDGVDPRRPETKGGEMLKNVCLVARLRASGGSCIGGDAGVNENVAA